MYRFTRITKREEKATHVDFATGGPSSVYTIHWKHPNCWPQPITGGGGQKQVTVRIQNGNKGTHPLGSLALTSTLP